MKKGKLYSVGVGPGDPELLTAKAIRVLSECDIVAVPQSDGGGQTALDIAAQYIKGKTVRSFAMPMTHDRAARDASHDAAADAICALIGEGKTVAFLTLGDPTVYSTAWYVHKRVAARGCEAELVPGVPSFCAAAARLGRALCEDGEMLHIIPASHGREREGLALPEVSLVAILDADKEGFLRSETSLVQTIGRAARNADGLVILYADTVTPSMKRAMDETERRRAIQDKYNKEHGIVPQTIRKDVREIIEISRKDEDGARRRGKRKLSERERDEEIRKLEKQMQEASRMLEFEYAAVLRDRIIELRKEQK